MNETPVNCKCGKKLTVYQFKQKIWVCTCLNPDCKVPFVTAESREKVIEKWNRRYSNG